MTDVRSVFEEQRARRAKLAVTTAAERVAKIRRLRDAMIARRADLYEAMAADFGKPAAEVEVTEIYPTLVEMDPTIKHLARWMRPHPVERPIVLFGTHSHVRYEPKGQALVLSPWNYPVFLFVNPIVAAIAAGNSVMARPSDKVRNTSKVLKGLFD